MKINRIIFILFVLSLTLRLTYIFSLKNQDIGCWDEEGWEIAKNLVEGKGYSMWVGVGRMVSARPPVFPLFLSGIFLFFGQNIIITEIILAIISSFSCIIIFLMGKFIFNQKVGLIAMAISAVYPPFIYWNGKVTPEALTILFLLLSSFFLLKTKERVVFYSILSGVFLGLLVMTRSMAYGLIPLFCLWVIFYLKNNRDRLVAFSLILLFSASIIFPWVARNYAIHHKIVLSSTEGGMTFFAAHNPETITKGDGDFYVLSISPKDIAGLSEPQIDKYFYKRGLDFIKNNPRAYLDLLFGRFIRFWRFYPHTTAFADSYNFQHKLLMLLTDGPLIILGIIGLFVFMKINKAQATLLFLVLFNFTIVSVLIRSCIRYRTPIMPYLIILSSYLIYAGYKKYANLRKE